MKLQRLAQFLAALWWGGMAGISFLAVPTLFASLGSPTIAGPVAAKLFSLQCWGGLILGLALLLILRRQRGAVQGLSSDGPLLTPQSVRSMQTTLGTMGFVLLAMLLAMVQEFGVAQKIVTARAMGGDLRLWHGLGSLMVLGQWLCAGAVLWRLGSAPPAGSTGNFASR
jgi:hypothetical protein